MSKHIRNNGVRSNIKGKRRHRKHVPQPIAWFRRVKRRIKRLFKRYGLASVMLFAIVATGVVISQLRHNNIFRSTISTSQYHGIDVSKHQGKIDWIRVAKDPYIQFAYIKATEGASFVDKNYRNNFDHARRCGIKVGCYHFFTCYKSPEAQFQNFMKQVKKSEQELIPMVDVEETGNRHIRREVLQARLKTFMNLVKQKYGVYPVLYSQYTFYNTMLAPEFNNYIIFIARYGKQEPVLRGGGKIAIWQYSEHGKIDGIKGCVDLDRFENGANLSDILL